MDGLKGLLGIFLCLILLIVGSIGLTVACAGLVMAPSILSAVFSFLVGTGAATLSIWLCSLVVEWCDL